MLAHDRFGEGPRIVLVLHGFLGSARNLATLARGLAQRRPDVSVIALDLTGHGESPPLPPISAHMALVKLAWNGQDVATLGVDPTSDYTTDVPAGLTPEHIRLALMESMR